MKKLLTVILILIMSVATVACGTTKSTTSTPVTKSGGNLRIGITTDPDGLDPHRTVAASTFTITNNIYDTLVGVTTKGEIVPRLAEKWSQSEDKKEITFNLKKGVKFHNGREMTAEDVKFSFNRLLEKESPRAADYSNISEINVIDPYTISFKTKQLDVALISTFAYPWTAIVPKEAVAELKTKPVGTGAFKLVEWIPQQQVVLEKNKDYYGKAPALDKVTFKTMPVDTSQIASLQAGELDMISISGDKVESLKSDPKITVIKAPQYSVQVLALNNKNKALSDVRVRQAISMALDKKAIIDGASWGFGDVIGSHMPTLSPNYIDTNSVLGHDVEKAKQLLAEAGYANGLELTIALPKPYKIHVDSGQIIADQLKKVGINVKIEIVEWGFWLKDIYTERKYDMTVTAHTGRLDPYVLLMRYDSKSKENYLNYNNEKIDTLLVDAKKEINDKKRKEIYNEIQMILAKEVPAVYIQTPYSLMAMNSKVKGMAFYPIDIYELKDISFES